MEDRGLARMHRGALLLILAGLPALAAEELNGHAVRLDASGKIIPWVQSADRAYAEVIRRAWRFLEQDVRVEDNGLKSYFSYCCLRLDTMRGTAWPHNPACFSAGITESALAWYVFSGDRKPLELARSLLDYQLTHGTTPSGWQWPGVPYASSEHGATEYRGVSEHKYGNPTEEAIGDGYGVIEPDKLGELGIAYLHFHQFTGEAKYLTAALACANALAAHVREGTWNQSPWPFRVWAETGRAREEYSSNVIGPIRLLDELIRTGIGDTATYRAAREKAWSWMLRFPLSNGLWSGYFEDVFLQRYPNNLNQYSPMETAKYLMLHPDLDVNWKQHAALLIDFVEKHFVIDIPNEPAVQWGANTISEQIVDVNKMGSHTSRYASALALWSQKTGDLAAKEKAARSLAWASYMCRDNGFVHVGPVDQTLWFSDGYADYIPHFLTAMGAVPEWSPKGEDHLLQSTSLVLEVSYAPHEIRYRTFDQSATDELRVSFRPASITADGKAVKDATITALGADFVVRISHSGARDVRVSGN